MAGLVGATATDEVDTICSACLISTSRLIKRITPFCKNFNPGFGDK